MNAESIVPKHVAIIMDGNGRWAKNQGKIRTEGHFQGAKVVKEIVEEAVDLGIKYLTLYAFSSENWKRPKLEIKALMMLLEQYLQNESELLRERGVRLRAMGDLSALPKSLQKKLKEVEEYTAEGHKLDLILALSYGGRAEIINAAKKIHQDLTAGELSLEQLDEASFVNYLYCPDVPDPELMIRTSNEVRLSNFLLWQLSYAELMFISELWPEFSGDVFRRCLDEYAERNRRFGAV